MFEHHLQTTGVQRCSMGRRTHAGGIVLLLILTTLSGCFGAEESAKDIIESYYPDIYERHTLDWNTSYTHSFLLNPGPHHALDVQETTIEVDTTGVWEGGPNSAKVHLSYWLPSNTQDGEQVPIIAVVSPYFSFGQPGDESTPTNVVGGGRGEFIFDNFIPHGYAFAQVAVFATEDSTGCFDYRGDGEGLSIHTAVEWLGQQEWSNGNVGIYGKSYEGATAWEAAAKGSSHLKTIVPISGTTALGPLLYKNGSAEARSQVMHSNYGGSILDYDGDDLDNMCADVVEGFLAGPTRYGLGDLDPYMDNYYDERSHIDKALGKYNGSIYWVQGLQDWNVDPHQVFGGPPGTNWYQEYIDNGYDVAGMIGQWEHNYPDQWTKHNAQESGYGGEAIHNMTRWDWAQDLFEWMEYYLKGIGPKPPLHAQVQRNDGQWRIEETWPPQDIEWLNVDMGECEVTNSFVSGLPVVGGVIPQGSVQVNCPPLDELNDIHIAGLVRFHLEAIPSFDGGQVFVEMRAQTPEGGEIRIGHATMDIRYHAGGYDAKTVIPGVQVTMLMEFQAIDAIIPAGSEIYLQISDTGEDYLAPACGNLCTVHVIPSVSTFQLPIIHRDSSSVLITPQSV